MNRFYRLLRRIALASLRVTFCKKWSAWLPRDRVGKALENRFFLLRPRNCLPFIAQAGFDQRLSLRSGVYRLSDYRQLKT